MARIILPHDSSGEAKAYIKALTGLSQITFPTPPNNDDLGNVLKVQSKYISIDSSASVGFGFGSIGGDLKSIVLVQDYWWLKGVDGTVPEINSWTFAVGFRVGIRIIGFKAQLDVGLGSLAAKAQTEGLNVQIQILRVGMPAGPDVPVGLAIPIDLDVDKFGELRAWQGEVISYVKDNRANLSPVIVSASINIEGEKLLNEAPGVRFALWRISKGKTLKEAIAYLKGGSVSEVQESTLRIIYSHVFSDSTMIIPGSKSEDKKPGKAEKNFSNEWLSGYKNL